MHQGSMRAWALTAVSLVACDGLKLKTETKPDPDVLRCAADPSGEGCDALFAAWCEKYPDDRTYCSVDAGADEDARTPAEDAAADAGADDAGEPEADAGCTCSDDTPVCLDDGSCVACRADDTAACPTDKPLCDEANACAACLENADCKSETAPVCSAGECVPCSNDEGCSDRGQICDTSSGQCEGCTLEREAERCGDNSCDPELLTCTNTRRGSVTICKACVADSECEADHRCIPMYFGTGDSKVELGGRCLKRLVNVCTDPFLANPIVRESLSGAAAEQYCGITEARTSCEAVLALLDGARCSDGQDSSCSGSGAICRQFNGGVNRCTYSCSFAAECPDGVSCPPAAADRYCGKVVAP